MVTTIFFEHQGQGELPHGSVHSRSSLGYGDSIIDVGEVSVVIAEAGRVTDLALTEQHVDQFGRVHAGVNVGKGQ